MTRTVKASRNRQLGTWSVSYWGNKEILGRIWAQRLNLSCSPPITACSEVKPFHCPSLHCILSLLAPLATFCIRSMLSCVQGSFTEAQSSTGSSRGARRYSACWSTLFAWCDWPCLRGNTRGSQVCPESGPGHRRCRRWAPGPGTQAGCLPSAALLSGPSASRTQGSPRAPEGMYWGRSGYSARWTSGSFHCHRNTRVYSPRQHGQDPGLRVSTSFGGCWKLKERIAHNIKTANKPLCPCPLKSKPFTLTSQASQESQRTISRVHGQRGSPGGSVVKNPPADAGDMGFGPWPGRAHVHGTVKALCHKYGTHTLELMGNYWVHTPWSHTLHQEKPLQ